MFETIDPPFHFDGHGIDDAKGKRIATLNIVFTTEHPRGNPDADKLGKLFEASLTMLSALENAYKTQYWEDMNWTEIKEAIKAARNEI